MRFSGQIRDTHVLVERVVFRAEIISRQELIDTFKYQISLNTIDNALKRLELDGKVKYCPRNPVFKWSDSNE